MRIKDISVKSVVEGNNWRLILDSSIDKGICFYKVEECAHFNPSDTIVYSGLLVTDKLSVVPLLLLREIASYEWWGDTCYYIDGQWSSQFGIHDQIIHEYIAFPLAEDPSFMGRYSHDAQRSGFQKWKKSLLRQHGITK